MVDFNLDIGAAYKSNDIALILQQIDILFDTTPRDVLGYEDYGSKYDEYLYKLNISPGSLQQKIESDLQSMNLFGFDYTIKVHLLQGTERDIALIDIVLTRDDESYQKVYKIS